jgi:rsbT co-antagonist protein RsbR
MATQLRTLAQAIRDDEHRLLTEWIDTQLASTTMRSELLTKSELNEQSKRFIESLRQAFDHGQLDTTSSAYEPVRQLLEEMSTVRARQGYTPSETAMFVFSLKLPLFARLTDRYKTDAEGLATATMEATAVLDRLGLYTTEVHQKSREQLIVRQQEEMMELSTPVIKLWDGILALPLIGTLDSSRTQVVMESLLQRIVDTGAPLAIIDITGVPTVDTLTAQHLLKTVAAARLMGADCIISGIRPQIAQTIVHLGVDLGDVITKSSLADAFAIALSRSGLSVQRVKPTAAQAQRTARRSEHQEDES